MIRASVLVATWFSLQVIVNPGSSGAPPAQPQRGVIQEISAASGEVDDIDRVGRMVTIKSAGAVQYPIYVGPDLPIFDQLSTGRHRHHPLLRLRHRRPHARSAHRPD